MCEEQGSPDLPGLQAGQGPGLHQAPAPHTYGRQGVLDWEEEFKPVETDGT